MTEDTVLLRQAHPNFMKGSLPTSQVFMPNSEDEGRMSVYDADQITPPDAYDHYTRVLLMQSHSVWGVTKKEADGCDVPASPDPLADFPSHARIDFSGVPETSWRKVAKRLKGLSIARGCLYVPTN